MIFNAFAMTLGQLRDPRFLTVLGLGVGLTLALLLGFYAAFVLLIGWLLPDAFTLPWIGEITWIDNALTWAGVPLMLILSVFLMVPVSTMFMGIFIEQVADAVEDRHYPTAGPSRKIALSEGVIDALKFLAVVIGVNLVAGVAYLLFAPIAPFLFWIVNGVLIGREFGQMVALRRHDAREAARFRKTHRMTLFAAGVLICIPLTIPVVNLLVPILAAATFTHLYHMLNRRSPARSG